MEPIMKKLQTSYNNENLCITELLNLYEESEYQQFRIDFTKHLEYVITKDNKEKSPSVQRILTIMSKFVAHVASKSENSTLLVDVLSYLLQIHKCTSSVWRFRICEMVATVLSLLNSFYLEDNICDEIITCMAVRLNDSVTSVKVEAIRALERLQDPSNPNDIVISKYVELLEDESAQVRKQVITSIANGPTTYQHFIHKILDVDPSVREATYMKLANGSISWLSIEHRQYVLSYLFKNTDKEVNPTDFVYSWYKGYGRNYIKFIAKFKLDADENDMWNTLSIYEKIVEIFFKNEPLKELTDTLQLNKSKLITNSENIFEVIVFWRCLIKYVITELPDQTYVDEIRPVLLNFCQFMEQIYNARSTFSSYWELTVHDFVMYELIRMVDDFNLRDQDECIALKKFLTDILSEGKLPRFVVIEIAKIFEELIPDLNKRMEHFCLIMSEIREPIEENIAQEEIKKQYSEVETLRMKLEIARENRNNALEAKAFDVAEIAHQEVQELTKEIERIEETFSQRNIIELLNRDIDGLMKCVDLFTSIMMSKDVKSMPINGLLPLGEFIIPHIAINVNSKLVAKCLKALALCCYVDKKLAQDNIYHFCYPLLTHKRSQPVDIDTLLEAMSACADLAVLYGPELFNTECITTTKKTHKDDKEELVGGLLLQQISQNENIKQISFKDVVESILSLLNDNNAVICKTSVKCLVNLLKNGILHCSNLITQLLIKWGISNETTQNCLSELIGDALTHYSERVQGSLKVIVEAFVPTINAVVNAPPKSPLLDINLDSLSKFMVTISDSSRHICNEGLDGHQAITLNILKEIRSGPNRSTTLEFIKILLLLKVPDEVEAIEELKLEVSSLLKIIKEKKNRNCLHKYRNKLDGTGASNTVSVTSSFNSKIPCRSVSKQNQINDSNLCEPAPENNTDTESNTCNKLVRKKALPKVKQEKSSLRAKDAEEFQTPKRAKKKLKSDSDEEKSVINLTRKGRRQSRKRKS